MISSNFLRKKLCELVVSASEVWMVRVHIVIQFGDRFLATGITVQEDGSTTEKLKK